MAKTDKKRKSLKTIIETLLKYGADISEPIYKLDDKGKPIRIRDNTSPTNKNKYNLGMYNSQFRNSSEYEDWQNEMLYKNIDDGKYRKPNLEYSLPFLPNKLIKVGNNFTTSNNLDSIAKYAYQANIPIKDALGLTHESLQGSSFYGNLPSALRYTSTPFKGTEDERKLAESIMTNANYHKSFGILPANLYVRDFKYDADDIPQNIPPLLHAFDIYDRGLYNPGKSSHTADTKRYGEEYFSQPNIQEWWNTSGKYFYNMPITDKTKKDLEYLESKYKSYKRKHPNKKLLGGEY